jgi:hypothetical protein
MVEKKKSNAGRPDKYEEKTVKLLEEIFEID